MSLRSFEELDCYKKAREFRKQISQFAKSFPVEEKFMLISQIVRASRSVSANIAEGYGRHHHKENLQYSRQARGSLTETLDHLNVALDEGYIDEKKYTLLREQQQECLTILNGYIGYLKRCVETGVPEISENR